MIGPPSNLPQTTHPTIAKWCIWSVQNQTWLAGQLRIYIWGATALAAYFTFAGLIELETALWAVCFSGVAISGAIWLLIKLRMVWLLNIRIPELRQQALAAMVSYLREVDHAIPMQPHGRSYSEDNSKSQADCTHSR